jgi:putative MATE family efflux protein
MLTSKPSSSFARNFLRLFLPAATQNLFFSVIGLIDVLMISQLGDAPVAAVGMAGQFFFLLNLTLFGTAGGAAMFAAQYWGARDTGNLRRVLGLCLMVGVTAAAGFTLVAVTAPGWVISLYTQDPAVANLGIAYLRIIGWSYLFTAVTISFATMVRSTGDTRLPMFVSVLFLSLNILLDYSLIFGKFGLPELGIRGAAIGTSLSRGLECLVLLLLLYVRRSPVSGTLRQLFGLDLVFISHHLRLIFLVFINEFVWALGMNAYNAIIARMGTSVYAAYNVTSTIMGLGLFYTMGCAMTSSILVGHAIGAGDPDKAYKTAGKILKISVAGAFIIGLLLVLARNPLLDLYRVSPQARADASTMILIAGLTLGLRGLDAMFIVGVLRSGGDTQFSALLDVGSIWLAGIPALALVVFVFHAPVEWVYLAIMSESLVKGIIGFQRYFSRRWIRNITSGAEITPPVVLQP